MPLFVYFFVLFLMVLFYKCTHVFVFFRGFLVCFVVQFFVLFLMDIITGYGLNPNYKELLLRNLFLKLKILYI